MLDFFSRSLGSATPLSLPWELNVVVIRPPWSHAEVTDLQPSFCAVRQAKAGAGDEARTRDVHLGKVVLYQLSYTRVLRANNNVHPPAPRNLLIAPAGVKLLNP